MKNKIVGLIVGLLCAACITVYAQTNQWYHSGEMDVQTAPIFVLEPVGKPEFGVSVESRYWETGFTATSLEVGNSDLGPSAYPGINYLTTKQLYRVVPFSTYPVLGRFSFEGSTGVTRFLYDGATGVPIGVEADFALTKRLGIFASGDQIFATIRSDSNLFLKAGLQVKF